MSRKEWIAVIVVIGLGIVWQIPRHDEAMPAHVDAHEHAPAPAPEELAGPFRTITLEVTGMT